MKPERCVVGITVSIDARGRWSRGRDYLYVARDYLRRVRRLGASPVLISPDIEPREVGRLCDALLLSGGDDCPAALWGEAQDPRAVLEDEERIAWERRLLDVFLESGRPVLAVCYGMQLLNVHLGGTLIQYLPADRDGDCDEPAGARVRHGGRGVVEHHPVEVEAGTRLEALIGAAATVSSSHRQAVAAVAPGLRACARAPDGVVEALELRNVLGVQWHPEIDATSTAVYRSLLLDVALSE